MTTAVARVGHFVLAELGKLGLRHLGRGATT
jgi:hypothetical protein